MHITAQPRTILEYHATWSAEDLARYRADPAAFVADVDAQLNGHAPVAPSLDAKAASPAKKYGGRLGRGRARTAKKTRARVIRPSAKPDLICPECAQVFKQQKRLDNHLAREHSQPATV